MNTIGESAADREISLTRTFDARPELVFDAWIDPRHISNWWGPNGFTTTTTEMDVRPGGVWLFVMHGPDGRDYPNKVVYREVDRPCRLVYEHMDEPNTEGVSILATVTFMPHGEKTELTSRMVFATKEERDRVEREYGAVEGLHNTFARLAQFLRTL